LLRAVAPDAQVVVLLINPAAGVDEAALQALRSQAHARGQDLHVVQARNANQVDDAFVTALRLRAGGMVVGTDAFLVNRSEQIGALARNHALPAIFQGRRFAAAGGLLSYGGSASESLRLCGVYVGRILKGEKPAELPVQAATKVELTINAT